MLLEDFVRFNEQFVKEEKYKSIETDSFPNKNAVILTCMDPRLEELLPQALDLKNGDVHMIKTAGALLTDPYDSVMRSLLMAVYDLRADEIFVIGHHDCQMTGYQSKEIIERMEVQGVDQHRLDSINNNEKDLHQWLHGFESVEDGVKTTVELIQKHPLLPEDLPVHGLVMDPATGKIDIVVFGY
ncbi:beta-class carbonic anhydrase [Sediminibacillus massiliensis]|uniref:beta-class carbonic anhydrase n=1 Tax=Sediminibacillus massiliensis TaxID=1926277 RepID=UPI00098874FB|nr:carbonic anhydrase [Sediminibacillus massiliensis]